LFWTGILVSNSLNVYQLTGLVDTFDNILAAQLNPSKLSQYILTSSEMCLTNMSVF